MGMVVPQPPADPVAGGESHEHNGDGVGPDDRRGPEVGGHQAGSGDLGSEARHPHHEDEHVEQPAAAAQVDSLILSSRRAPWPAAAARAARASLSGTPRWSARSRSRCRSVSCLAHSRKSQASTPSVTNPPSTIISTPAMLWSVTAEMCHLASPAAESGETTEFDHIRTLPRTRPAKRTPIR